jgi:hypothetical protein
VVLGRGHRAGVGRHAATHIRRPTADQRPPITGDCYNTRAAPHGRSREILSRLYSHQVTFEQQEQTDYKNKRPRRVWGGAETRPQLRTQRHRAGGRVGGGARGRAPSSRAAKSCIRGYQARVGQDFGWASLRCHAQESCPDRRSRRCISELDSVSVLRLNRYLGPPVDYLTSFSGFAGPWRPAGQQRRAAGAGRVLPEAERPAPGACRRTTNKPRFGASEPSCKA